MNAPKLFGVYTAQFPFLDSKEAQEDIDVSLGEWNEAGLLKPSIARIHRLTTMLQADLIAELGVLRQRDTQAVQDSLRELLNL